MATILAMDHGTPLSQRELAAILQAPSNANAFCLLQQLHARLSTHLQQGHALPAAWHTWWDLMRFCLGSQSVVDWLVHEPSALQRIHALLVLSGEEHLAAIVGDALQGQAQDTLQLHFSQLGADDIAHTLQSAPEQHYLGQDWASTDTALALHSEGFANTVASLIRSEAGTFAFSNPSDSNHPAATPLAEPDQVAARQQPALALHELLAHTLQISVLTVQAIHAPAQQALLPMTHRVGEPMPTDWLDFHAALWADTPKADLLAAYALYDGAQLFCHAQTTGLNLLPIQQWDDAQQQMLAWALAHTWQDAPADMPAWLATAICFAQQGESHEYWLLVTEGPLQGKVLLSETDAPLSHARFASLQAFFETLQAAPQRILNATGQVAYLLDGAVFEPVGVYARLDAMQRDSAQSD